jgi:hypothetical protein
MPRERDAAGAGSGIRDLLVKPPGAGTGDLPGTGECGVDPRVLGRTLFLAGEVNDGLSTTDAAA